MVISMDESITVVSAFTGTYNSNALTHRFDFPLVAGRNMKFKSDKMYFLL